MSNLTKRFEVKFSRNVNVRRCKECRMVLKQEHKGLCLACYKKKIKNISKPPYKLHYVKTLDDRLRELKRLQEGVVMDTLRDKGIAYPGEDNHECVMCGRNAEDLIAHAMCDLCFIKRVYGDQASVEYYNKVYAKKGNRHYMASNRKRCECCGNLVGQSKGEDFCKRCYDNLESYGYFTESKRRKEQILEMAKQELEFNKEKHFCLICGEEVEVEYGQPKVCPTCKAFMEGRKLDVNTSEDILNALNIKRKVYTASEDGCFNCGKEVYRYGFCRECFSALETTTTIQKRFEQTGEMLYTLAKLGFAGKQPNIKTPVCEEVTDKLEYIENHTLDVVTGRMKTCVSCGSELEGNKSRLGYLCDKCYLKAKRLKVNVGNALACIEVLHKK